MMLPILISVSVAPVSYFFCASALPEVAAKAITAVDNAALRSCCTKNMTSPFLVFPDLADQAVGDERHLPCAMRNQEDDDEQQHAEYGAGKTFRNPLRDVGHEHDERRADDRSRQPTDAADHH